MMKIFKMLPPHQHKDFALHLHESVASNNLGTRLIFYARKTFKQPAAKRAPEKLRKW